MNTELAAATTLGGSTRGVLPGLTVGVASVAAVAVAEPGFVVVVAAPLLIAAVLAVIDQQTSRIANRHNLVLAAVTAICVTVGVLVHRGDWTAVAAGAAIWSIPLFAAAVSGGVGGGDFKYATSLGALCGWVSLTCAALGLMIALLAGSVIGVASAIRQRSIRSRVRLGLPLYSGAVAAIILEALQ